MISTKKMMLIGGGSLLAMTFALGAPAIAFAQAAAAVDTAQVEEVVVTGSRIQNGFQTPTPVTVATATALRDAAPGNLADGLNQLPVFNGSTKTTQTTGGGLNGLAASSKPLQSGASLLVRLRPSR